MLLGVLSDTHDHVPLIGAALSLFAERKVEAMIHAGDFVAPFAVRKLLEFDGQIYPTYGNNDGEREGLKALLPQIQDGPLFVEIDDCTILVHHYIGMCKPEDVQRATVVITGHSHQIVNRLDESRLFLNPGECCGWVNGRATAAILDTAGPSAEIIDLEPQG